MTAWQLPCSIPWWSCTLTLCNHKPQINPLFCTWPWSSCFCHSNRNMTETAVLECSLSRSVIETASVQALRHQRLSPTGSFLRNLQYTHLSPSWTTSPECHPPNTRSLPTKRPSLKSADLPSPNHAFSTVLKVPKEHKHAPPEDYSKFLLKKSVFKLAMVTQWSQHSESRGWRSTDHGWKALNLKVKLNLGVV